MAGRKQCQYCKRNGFHWVEINGRWRLADRFNVLHTCEAALTAYRIKSRTGALPAWAARSGSAQVTAGRVPPGVRQQPKAEPAPMPTLEAPGFRMTPCMIAINEGRSKYSPAEAATDTRRFNDMEVYPLVSTGPEFQFIGV